MTRYSIPAIAAAGALGLVLGASVAPARAQDNGAPAASNQDQANENVEITAPRYRERRSAIGAPIIDVSLSHPVRYDDLDLRTDRGADILEARIRRTARELCNKLDVRYPVTAEGSPPCYSNAVRDAMYQADDAISAARGYADTE